MNAPLSHPARPSPALREALQWGYRDALQEIADLISSIGISLREAAYRGHDDACRCHVVQLRLSVLSAIDAIKQLESVSADLPPAQTGGAA